MKWFLFLVVVLVFFVVGCVAVDDATSDVPAPNAEDPVDDDILVDQVVVGDVVGPGGCVGGECDVYFRDNPEESQIWCGENPVACGALKGDGQESGFEGPGGCTDCEAYCDVNEQECKDWCAENSEKNPELCGFIMMEETGREGEARQGDGVWEKNELTFYIKDEKQVLSEQKKIIIRGTVTSDKKIGSAFLGWNAALEELNRLYPDNIVPDVLVETYDEDSADIVIEVHSEKEFCCDLAGLPVKGVERSTIGNNHTKLRSDVDIYNIIAMDTGFLEDVSMHELGHSLGLFGHVTDRNNDLMSIISPGRGIKKGNLDDLYMKYRDRKIETVGETRERDEGVRENIVRPPD